MSASIEEIKKFLQDKSQEDDTKTLKVTRLGVTSGGEGYRVFFLPAIEAPKEPAKKKVATPIPSKSKGKD